MSIAYIQHGRSMARFTLPEDYRVRKITMEEISERKPVPEEVAVFPFRRVPSAGELQLLNTLLSRSVRDAVRPGFLVMPWLGKKLPGKEMLTELLGHFDFPERVEVVADTRKEAIVFILDQLVAKSLAFEKHRSISEQTSKARRSSLDSVQAIIESSADLREANGRLSAKAVAEVFGIKQKDIAEMAGISAARLNRTPDAEPLQPILGFFERIARLRVLLKDDPTFRKWLRTAVPALGEKSPFELLKEEQFQVVADYVDDILTGAPG